MKSSVNNKIIAITGMLLILAVIVIFRGQKRMHSSVTETSSKDSSERILAPSKDNVSPSFISHIDLLKKKVSEHPTDIVSIRALAQMLMDSHKTDEAIQYFKQGLKLQPKNDSLLLDLSVCYFKNKNYAQAMEITERILKRNSNHTRALLNKGVLLAVQNDETSAKKIFHKVISIAPKSEEAKQAENYLVQLKNQ